MFIKRHTTDNAPVEDAVPEGLVHYHQWPEYNMAAELPAKLHAKNSGTDPIGVWWKSWPCTTALYIGDSEPAPTNDTWTLAYWQRMAREDIPRGWWQPFRHRTKREAFIELRADTPYWKMWSKSTRQYRNRWRTQLRNITYHIVPVEFLEFKQAYETSLVAKRIGGEEFSILERKWNDPATRPFLSLIAVKEHARGTLAAGMAILHSPTYNSTYYQTGFVCPTFAKEHLMVGLMDYWFEQSQKQNIRFLALGHIWKEGNALARKGYSDFKLQFAPLKILFPPILLRIQHPSRIRND